MYIIDFLKTFYEENRHLGIEDYVRKAYKEFPHYEDVGYLVHLYMRGLSE